MRMTQTFTCDEILRYAYNELNESENQQIEDAMMHDEELLEFYLDCIDMKTGLNQIQMQPSTKSVNRILAYSQNYARVC
jgi:hypothetical protein